ncbi:MAG: 50S ribosomal protein L17 [Cytophagia bacterium]|nr:50S ribosomal protein L17 [Cytophagia bacterium]
MRHGNTINHLSRTYGHRKAMLRNMAVSLILNKRINTTLAKAKELRKFVEPVLTRSKSDTMHNRRMVFADLQDKEAVKELFATVAEKIATRPGGYTRIIKTGFRLGDAAEMCMMELVDFNELLLADAASRKAKTTRRSRSSKKSSSGLDSVAPVAAAAPVAELVAPLLEEEAPAVVEEAPAVVEEAPAAVDEAPAVVDEAPAVVEEAPAAVDEAPADEASAPEEDSPEQEEPKA